MLQSVDAELPKSSKERIAGELKEIVFRPPSPPYNTTPKPTGAPLSTPRQW